MLGGRAPVSGKRNWPVAYTRFFRGHILYHSADLVEPIVAGWERHARLNRRTVWHYLDHLERSIGARGIKPDRPCDGRRAFLTED